MPNVILVDDEYWALKNLESLLSEYPAYTVTHAFTNPRQALSAILRERPDVVFTDLRMDLMDGRELLLAVSEGCPDTRLVIISAYSDFQVATEAIRNGVFDYLLKPVEQDGMARLMHRLDGYFQDRGAQTPERLLSGAAAYSQCCCLYCPDSATVQEVTRAIRACVGTPYALTRDASPDSDGRFLLLSAPTLSLVLDDLPSGTPVGVSCTYGNFSAIDCMRNEALISYSSFIRYSAHPLIARIQAYLCANYSCEMSIEEIADSFSLNKTYLCDLFRTKCGTTVFSFLQAIRMGMARSLLSGTDDSVVSIARSVGYNDPAYFSRLFKKQVGMSPDKYRQTARTQIIGEPSPMRRR